MASSRKKKLRPGQLPMFPPESTWEPPAVLPDFRGRGIIALDTETRDDGLAAERGAGWAYGPEWGWIAGVGMAAPRAGGGTDRVYAPVRHPDTTTTFDRDAVVRWVRDHVRDPGTRRVVFFHAHYDIGWFGTDFGLYVPEEKIVDAQAMAVAVDENQPRGTYGLDWLCRRYGVPGKDLEKLREAAEAFGYDYKSELWKMPARYVGLYGEQDPDSTLGLHDRLLPVLEREDLLGPLQLEMDIVPMVVAMRRRGIRLNAERCLLVQAQLRERYRAALAELTDRLKIGREVTLKDVNSTHFLERVFEEEGVYFPRTTKTEQGSFSKDWMVGHEHWLPRLVSTVSKYEDAAEKFVGKYLLGFSHRGRIHAEIHQYRSDDERGGTGRGGGTRSFRFSYSEPPLQQMPHRDEELSGLIRGAFEPEEGELWDSADYSQQEYRLIVHFAAVCRMAGAEHAVRAYQENPHTDFHDFVAKITGLDRKPAKDTNFAKAFGAGIPKFASMIGKSVEEAGAIYKQYDEEMPFVSRLAEFCQRRADKRGYLRLIDGARSHFDRWEPRYLPKDKWLRAQEIGAGPCSREEAERRCADREHPWHGERLRRAETHKAMNRLIQGSAARMTKLAMRGCWREGLLPLIQMHDELGFSFGEERQVARVAEIMRDAVQLVVPVAVDSEVGLTWGHARKVEEKLPDGKKRLIYGATFVEAAALLRRVT